MGIKKEHAELSYPHGVLNPHDWLRFLELKPFMKRRHELNISDEYMRAIQIGIMISPKGSPVIPGTGGVRKLRFFRPDSSKGKRGGLRVLYVYFEAASFVAFLTAYAKGEIDNITPAQRKAFKNLIKLIENGLNAF